MVHDFTPVPAPQGEGSPGFQNQHHDQIQQSVQYQQVQYYALPPQTNKRIIARMRKSDQPSTTRPKRVTRTHATNACTKCRERKTKCSAEQPCKNCTTNDYECRYTMGKRERAKIEREELESERDYLRVVVEIACRLLRKTEEEILASKIPNEEQSDDSRDPKRVKRDHPIAEEEAKGNIPHSSPADATTSFGSGVPGDFYGGSLGCAVVTPRELHDHDFDTLTTQWLPGGNDLFTSEVAQELFNFTGYACSN
ncbi:Zn(II)2Cys6 transcription factor domain-containing protein [Aspergillus stella-maris]|uniref:Zn(II)2Cys6 transcription factor domain-containing protein n=1 Tax=Aspergillus stella-maris TaxID=1810926 RepID=UPI003CCD2084